MKNLTFFAPIEKVDEELRMVYGYASTEALDSQGEVVKKDALSGAIEDYMKFANIREMHQPSAVGKAKSAELNEKGMYIAAKIVDDIIFQFQQRICYTLPKNFLIKMHQRNYKLVMLYRHEPDTQEFPQW